MVEFAEGRLTLYPRPQMWDTTVVYIESRAAWWWNAWRLSTLTERSGYAETEQAAWAEMADAISEAGEPRPLADTPDDDEPESGPGS